jgi:hypothetical protein
VGSSKKGRIFKDYWIQCALCECMTPLGASKYPAALGAAKDGGWRYVKGRGWLCGDCVADRHTS